MLMLGCAMRSVASKIEVIDPSMPEKPVVQIVVPGEVVPEQIRKDLRIGLTIKVELGEKKKSRTANIKIYDEDLRSKIEEYVNSFVVVIKQLSTEESVKGEVKMRDIKTIT